MNQNEPETPGLFIINSWMDKPRYSDEFIKSIKPLDIMSYMNRTEDYRPEDYARPTMAQNQTEPKKAEEPRHYTIATEMVKAIMDFPTEERIIIIELIREQVCKNSLAQVMKGIEVNKKELESLQYLENALRETANFKRDQSK